MAANLRAKLPPSDQLLINDRNGDATAKFVQEVGSASGAASKVEALTSARAVAERSVSAFPTHAVWPIQARAQSTLPT